MVTLKKINVWVFCFTKLFLNAQNPSNHTFPTPTPNPPNLTVNSYSRATNSINLKPGFKYGFVSGGATNLLNLNIGTYPNYVNNNYSDPSSNPQYYSPNPNMPVATTEGAPSVDQIGSFSYNIPIICSPGTAGLQPNISILYNSNTYIGLLGNGFSLGGISYITRTAKTLFYDGQNQAIDLSSDPFTLDGSRLIPDNWTGSFNNSTYKLEVDNHNIVTSFGTVGNGPQYFSVVTPAGLTMEYGTTAASHVTDIQNSEVLTWFITRIKDRIGNYMDFDYVNINGEALLKTILYTGTSSTAPYNKIEFEYVDRSDNAPFYIAGKEFRRTKILKTVICRDLNNSIVRKYVLDYSFDLCTLLSKITEVDGLGNQLNPTFLHWKINPKETGKWTTAAIAQGRGISYGITNVLSTISADVNGDGLDDVIAVKNNSVDVPNTSEPSFFDIFLSKNTFASPTWNTDLTTIPYSTNHELDNSVIQILAATAFDEDDDGFQEVFITYTLPEPPNLPQTMYYIKKLKTTDGIIFTCYLEYSSTKIVSGQNFVSNWRYRPFYHKISETPGLLRSPFTYSKYDVTGDNLNDIIISDQNEIRIVPSTGQTSSVLSMNDIIKVRPGDYDGDGVADLFVLRRGDPLQCNHSFFTLQQYKVDVYKFNSSTNMLNLVTSKHYSIGKTITVLFCDPNNIIDFCANGSDAIDFGDFNGDGKTDIFHLNFLSGPNAELFIDLSDGLNFLPPISAGLVSKQVSGFDAAFYSTDINNDGFSDWCATAHDEPNSKSYFTYYPSLGTTLSAPAPAHDNNNRFAGTMGDFDGDGTLDYLGQISYQILVSADYNIYHQNSRRLVDKIYNIKNEYKINYNLLAANSAETGEKIYNKTSPINASPFTLIKPAIFVVYSTSFNWVSARYGYQNGLFHRLGKGFLGFEKTYIQNTTLPAHVIGPNSYYRGSVTANIYNNQIDAITEYETTNIDLDKLDIFSIGGNRSSHVKNNFSYTHVSTINGNHRYLNSTYLEQRDYLKSIRKQTFMSLDNSKGGNPQTIITSYADWLTGTANNIETKTFLYSTLSLPAGQQYFVPQKTTVGMIEGTNWSSFETDYNYDSGGRLLTQTDNSNISGKQVTTTYSQYNVFGTATKISISAADIAQARNTQVVFDPTGRFVTKSTNNLGHFVESTYDPSLGNLVQHRDISGLITTYKYNGLGQLIEYKTPNGAINSRIYEWYNYTDNNFTPAKSAYAPKLTYNNEETGISVAYLDVTGREIKSETTGFGGSQLEKLTSYDAAGRVISAKDARFINQTDYKEFIYEYDKFSRLIKSKVQLPNQGNTVFSTTEYFFNGLSTNTAYSKGSTTVESQSPGTNGKVRVIKQTDESGRIDKVKNVSGNIVHTAEYTFNEKGQPLQIKVMFPGVSNAVTTFLYDPLGRQSQLNDPSAGIHAYSYNSIGELTTSTSPSGTFNYTYDQLGRISSKNITGMGNYTYQYITANNGKELIWKIIGPDVITEYSYDNFSRVVEKKETVAGNQPKQFIAQYTYDKYHRFVNRTYPGGFMTTNEYDPKGFLLRIKNGNNTLWELKSEIAPSLVNQYQFHNGTLNTNVSYDDKLNLIEFDYAGLCKQTYSIHPATGDVLYRTKYNYQSSANNNEQFEYDDFDRLTQTKYKNSQNISVPKLEFSYYENGNFNKKDDCGEYFYATTNQPYLLTSINSSVSNLSFNTLNVTYNEIEKVKQITENNAAKQFDFVYGNDAQRIKMTYKTSGTLQYTRYYQEEYDRQETSNSYKEWSYVYSPTGLCAIYYNNNGTAQVLYVTTDHLGSPLMVTSASGAILEENSFDTWGRKRNPANWNDYTTGIASQYLIRGFTGHEHLTEVGLINMNGRVYDPVLGRFIQPDNYVQSPDNLQNFNRFGYCLNNPLKYTDPSGNFIALVAWPMGFVTNVIGNMIEGGHANVFKDAYDQTNWFFNIMSSATRFAVYSTDNTQVSIGIDPFALGISVGVSHRTGDVTTGVSVGVGLAGFNACANIAYNSPGGIGVSAGGGLSKNSYSYGGSLSYKGNGIGYYQTHYGKSSNNPTNSSNAQTVGGISIFGKNWSARMENDFFAGTGDKWRTGAMQLTVGKFSVGFSVYTNEQLKNKDPQDPIDLQGESRIWGKNNRERKEQLGAWENGTVFDSPVWFGYNSGMGVSRIGFSHPSVQDFTQNGIHKWVPFGHQNFYNKYSPGIKHAYSYNGYENPYSLYGN